MKLCGTGHVMTAVPISGSVKLVCVTCLRGAVNGPGRVRRGCDVKVFRLVELVNKLEASESGGEFAPLDVADVPGFDKLFAACDTAGVPFSSDGLRALARRIAAKTGAAVAKVMAMTPDNVADSVGRLSLRPERACV